MSPKYIWKLNEIKMNNALYTTYLINLDRSQDRLEFMKKEFDKQQIHFERIPAVDGALLNGSEYLLKNKYDRNLVPGEIGCYLSHVKALQTLVASEYLYAVIIEDDAVLSDDFKKVVEKSIAVHHINQDKKADWDVLKLFNGKRRHIKIEDIDENHFIAACGTSVPITTIAAIWTRSAAEKFLSKIMSARPIVRRPIDCDLQHPWEFNLRIYNLLPSIVRSGGMATQIQLVKKLRKSNVPRQIVYEINRFFPKYFYLIHHHGWKPFYDSFIAKKNKKIS